MPRLIDADAEIKELEKMKVEGEVFTTAVNFAKITLREAPTIDAVEVIRCKDCKYWDKDWQTIEGCHYCCMIDMQTEGEFFCAKGERR